MGRLDDCQSNFGTNSGLYVPVDQHSQLQSLGPAYKQEIVRARAHTALPDVDTRIYKVYLKPLSKADNLTHLQVQESLSIAQKNCPMLELSLPGDRCTAWPGGNN
jgi:hypothetical protein